MTCRTTHFPEGNPATFSVQIPDFDAEDSQHSADKKSLVTTKTGQVGQSTIVRQQSSQEGVGTDSQLSALKAQ